MKIVLMQPYFFPYVGYFTLLKHSELFVVFDTAQYIRRGWIHRNRIIGPKGDPVYISACVEKSAQKTKIESVQLKETSEWKEKLMKSLEVYRKTAPHYEEVRKLVLDCISYPSECLVDFNIYSLEKVCEYLGFEPHIKRLSEMDIPFKDIRNPDDWGLQLSKFYGADTYINAPGGQQLYSKEKYEQSGVKLVFYQSRMQPYDQRQETFHCGLSILDILMFNSKEEVNEMIDDYVIL